MSIRTKLMTAIMSLVLVLGLLAVGVYALDKAEVMLGGNLTFTADGVYAEVTGSVDGAVTNPTYEDLLFSANNTPDQSSWQENTLAFDANGTDIVITINIHNLANDRPLYAKISDTAEEVENVVKSVKKDGADVLDEPFEVTAGQTAVITITFDLQNVNLSLDANSLYGYKIELSKDSLETYYTTAQWQDASVVGEGKVLKFTIADGEASVSMLNITDTAGDIVVPAYVLESEGGTPIPVTQIPSYAFGNPVQSAKITSVKLPKTIKSIGDSAFSGCTGLTSVTIPDSVQTIGKNAFKNCSGLTSITIPDRVETIGESAFYNCSSLTSITIPDSVTSIGVQAFYGCSVLTSITIPDSVTSIGIRAFYCCSNLTSVTIGNSVTSIGVSAFYCCSSLTSITIPDSVQTIGASAFSDCTGLTSITIPDSVQTIGDFAFSDCTGLTSVTIGSGVTSIGTNIFASCDALETIAVESGNSVYDSRNNCNAIIETATNTLIQGCKNTIIPEDIQTIGDFAFSSCRVLTSITIPDSVTSIGNGAFSYCKGLKTVVIDSETIASSLSGNSSSICGYILYTATSVYVKTDIVDSLNSYVKTNYTNVTTITEGDYAGYTCYAKA